MPSRESAPSFPPLNEGDQTLPIVATNEAQRPKLSRREALVVIGGTILTLLTEGKNEALAGETLDIATVFPAASEAERRERFGVPLAELTEQNQQVILRVLGIFRQGDWSAYLALHNKYDRERMGPGARPFFEQQQVILTAVDNASVRAKFYASDGHSLATIAVFYPKDKVSFNCFILLKEGRRWFISWGED